MILQSVVISIFDHECCWLGNEEFLEIELGTICKNDRPFDQSSCGRPLFVGEGATKGVAAMRASKAATYSFSDI
jgi:hypothetical protein